MSAADGHETEPERIRFGPRPDDDMPRSWGESMLISWRKASPAAFGKALARAATEREGDR
jgi:hypothetical protein